MNVPSNVAEVALHGILVLAPRVTIIVNVCVGCNGTRTVAVRIKGFDTLIDRLNVKVCQQI